MREVKRVEWEVDEEFAAEVRVIFRYYVYNISFIEHNNIILFGNLFMKLNFNFFRAE